MDYKRIITSAENIYNSYLLLNKLSGLKDREDASLSDLVSQSIRDKNKPVTLKIDNEEYKVEVTQKKKGRYAIKLVGHSAQSPDVKEIDKYNNDDIINLWSNKQVFLNVDDSGACSFSVAINDELEVGGPGKMIPLELRFFYFYKVIQALKGAEKEGKLTFEALSKHLRIANNIATGSGKTGDIALIKLLCYLEGIDCIVAVPNKELVQQAADFDKEFLPDKVCKAFNSSSANVATSSYLTADFNSLFNNPGWQVFHERITRNNPKTVLCIDEAPKLKENLFFLERAKEISKNIPLMVFSATPDERIKNGMKIQSDIFCSPKKRSELGIGKLPEVIFKQTESPIRDYFADDEKNHWIIGSGEETMHELDEQKLLDILATRLDSSSSRRGLIVTTEDSCTKILELLNFRESCTNDRNEVKRKTDRKSSFAKAIKELVQGLDDEKINQFIDDHLEIETTDKLLKFIPMHGLINLTKQFLIGKNFSNYTIDKQVKEIKEKLNHYGNQSTHSDAEIEKRIELYLKKEHNINNNYGYEAKVRSLVYQLVDFIKKNLNNNETLHSIVRNYAADKRLHRDLIANICEQGSVGKVQIEEFCKQSSIFTFVLNNDGECKSKNKASFDLTKLGGGYGNPENVLNMFRAGLVGMLVADAERAIGFNDLTLNKIACLTEGANKLSDPANEMQALGRGGRSNSGESYVFYRYTNTERYLDHNDLINLEGNALCKKFYESKEKYIKDVNNIAEGFSKSLIRQTLKAIKFDDEEYAFFTKYHIATYNIFAELNIQYSYNQELVTKLFALVMTKVRNKLAKISHEEIVKDVVEQIEQLEEQTEQSEEQIKCCKEKMEYRKNAMKKLKERVDEIVGCFRDSVRLSDAMDKASQDRNKIISFNELDMYPSGVFTGGIFTAGEMSGEEVLNYKNNYFNSGVRVFTTAFLKRDKEESGYDPKLDDISLDEILKCKEENNSQTELHKAASEGNLDKAKELIRNGLDVNAQDLFKMTPLHYAAKNGYRNIVKFLLGNDAYIDIKAEPLGKNPFHYAVEGGNAKIITDLLEKDENYSFLSQDNSGKTPLHYAVGKDDINAVKALLCNPEHSGIDYKNLLSGKTPLHLAVQKATTGILEALLTAKKTNVNVEDYSKKAPLHYAVEENNINAVKILLENKADFNQKDILGMTPLHYAAKNGCNEVIELLLGAGSNVNNQDTFGWTPLHFAAHFGHTEAIKALLTGGGSHALKDWHNETPIDLAKNESVRKLLEEAESKRVANRENASPILNKPDNESYAYKANIPHSTKGNKLPIMTASAGLLLGIGLCLAYFAGAAALTPGAAAAIFVVAAAVGASVGYGVGKLCEKVSEEKQKNPNTGTWDAAKSVLSNVFTTGHYGPKQV